MLHLIQRIRAVADNAERRPNQAMVKALEGAQAEAHRAMQRAERDAQRARAAEAALRAVIRGIDTAPMSTTVNALSVSQSVAHGNGLSVRAPHVTWAPLNTALVDAKRFLDGHRHA